MTEPVKLIKWFFTGETVPTDEQVNTKNRASLTSIAQENVTTPSITQVIRTNH